MEDTEHPKRGRWTEEEREEFERLLTIYGKEWKKIAELLKTRTVVQVRTHAQKYFKKLAKSTGTSVLSTSKKQGLFIPNDGRAEDEEESQEEPPLSQMQYSHSIHDAHPSTFDRAQRAQRRASFREGTVLGLENVHKSSSFSSNDIDVTEESSEEREGKKKRRFSRRWSTVTPRTMAAATILAAPTLRKNLNSDEDELEGKLSWAMTTLQEEGLKKKRRRRV